MNNALALAAGARYARRMSYLEPPRLQFSGRFQAGPSTVNNDASNFDNATFRLDGQSGAWNPRGDAAWRLLGCKVTSASRADGSAAPPGDPVLTCVVADSDSRVCAKIVDLDPEQQLVSQIWGLEVRVCAPDGTALVRGAFTPAAFTNIWNRATTASGGDITASAVYQSVLTGVEWGDVSSSAALSDLRQATEDGVLSICFTVDGYNMNAASPNFTLGRIAGAIGPAHAGEPRHFVRGRQLQATPLGGGFFRPAGKLNFCTAVVDERLGKVHLDLANALPTDKVGGPPSDLGWLSLTCDAVDNQGHLLPISLGSIDYLHRGWYERTAGIVSLPPGRRLSPTELSALAVFPLTLRLDGTAAVAEHASGLHVRADDFVFRLDAGEPATVTLYASQFGAPLAGARIVAFLDSLGLQGQGEPDPGSRIDFPARVIADEQGVAQLPITTSAPGNPRGSLDGIVFGIRPAVEGTLGVGANYAFNPWDFVSLLIWDEFAADDPPTWHGAIHAIFQQYANLYPVMDRLLDLGSYESVCAHLDALELAYGLDPSDPNSMPVTRDLSAAKRAAILRWLREPGEDGKPRLGTPPPPEPAVAAADAAPPEPADAPDPALGGKTAAADRRLALRMGGPR